MTKGPDKAFRDLMATMASRKEVLALVWLSEKSAERTTELERRVAMIEQHLGGVIMTSAPKQANGSIN